MPIQPPVPRPPPPAPPPPNELLKTTALQMENGQAFQSSPYGFKENNRNVYLNVSDSGDSWMTPGRKAVQHESYDEQITEEKLGSSIHARTDAHYLSIYRAPTPVLQIGPRCGLVALSMAADILLGTSCCDDELIRIAISKGFTQQGEMFSAVSMCDLVNGHLNCTARTVNLREAFSDLIEALLHGDLAIVPYDADGNHEPCLKRGHKAHWALIAGCLIPMSASLQKKIPESMLHADPVCPNLFHCRQFSYKSINTRPALNETEQANPMTRAMEHICCELSGISTELCCNSIQNEKKHIRTYVGKSDLGETDDNCIMSNNCRMCNEHHTCCLGKCTGSVCFNNDNNSDIHGIVTSFYSQEPLLNTHIIPENNNMTELGKDLSALDPQSIRVFAHHGKSRHVGTWWLNKLITSNSNLVEVNPDIQKSQCDYVIPSGGIGEGLCGKVVIVSRRSKEVDIA